MSQVDPHDLAQFAEQADAWFRENVNRDPGFMLPLTFMEVGTDQQFHFLRDWQHKVYEAGYLGAAWPREYGGGGLDRAFQNEATKAMRRHNAPIMLNAIGLNWTGPLLLDIGSQQHKRKHLKRILSAEDIWCQGFSEPENGSDLGNAQTRAVRDGEVFIINGSKIWTTLGRYADYMILLARTNPKAAKKYDGLSFILAPMKIEGVETRPIRKLTGEHGFTQTFFTNARVPADGLVGEEGGGWKVAMRTLEYERGARAGQAGGYVAISSNAFDVVELAKRARRGGEPALADPVVADQMIEFIMEIQSLALCGQRQGVAPLVTDRPLGLPLSSKLMGSEFGRRLNEFAIRLTGLRGAYYVGEPNAVDDGIWTRAYLNAFSSTIGGGTSQIQHNIVGEHVLGLPKELSAAQESRELTGMQDLGQIGFSEAQGDLLAVASEFCRKKSSIAKVRRLIEDELGHDLDLWREIAELGWLGVAIPEAFGGSDLTLGEVVPIVEQLGRNLIANPFVSTTLTAQAVLVAGTPAQKHAVLPALASGRPGALALTERDGDWEQARFACRAEVTQEGFRFTGKKALVCDLAIADYVVLGAELEGQAALFLLDSACIPPAARRREKIIDETKRSFELSLDAIAAPKSAVMDLDRASAGLAHLHLAANLLDAAEMCGAAQAVIDYTLEYAKTRLQFGRPIGAYQAVKHPLVEAYIRYEQARSHLYSAAHCFDRQGAGEIAVRMAKAQADKALSFAADRAIQFHGGFGFTYDCDAQLYRRRGIFDSALHGDAGYHKRKLAALLL